jgi:hypothetical protein
MVTTVTPELPGIPRAMVLTVSFALFPAIGLVCHRRSREALASQELGISVEMPEPRDFSVRVRTRSSVARDTSIASRPTSVTIAKRPLVGVG